MNKYFHILAFFVITIACNTNEQKNTQNPTPPPALPQDFIKFYESFHTDSIFQLNHIQFPLWGMDSLDQEIQFQKKEWVLHHKFQSNSALFEQKFQKIGNQLLKEWIYSEKLGIYMERRWAKLDSQWHLIYYKPLSK